MAPRHLDLLFEQVEIVEEPLGGMSHASGLTCRLGGAVIGPQNLLVLIEARQQPVRAGTGHELVLLGQGFSVAHQLFHAKEFGAKRCFINQPPPRLGFDPVPQERFQTHSVSAEICRNTWPGQPSRLTRYKAVTLLVGPHCITYAAAGALSLPAGHTRA